MKVFIILSVIVAFVQSQTSPQSGNSTLPQEVLTSLQVLKSDIHKMRSTNSWDAQKIGADLTAVGTSIQSKIDNMPDDVKKRFENLQSRFQAIQNGTVNSQMIKEAVHKSFQFIDSIYPGTKEVLHSERRGNKNSTIPSV